MTKEKEIKELMKLQRTAIESAGKLAIQYAQSDSPTDREMIDRLVMSIQSVLDRTNLRIKELEQ